MSHVYKICPAQLWDDAVAAGIFKGAAIDLEDGYIHFSTAAQAQETARRHFRHQENLVLVTAHHKRPEHNLGAIQRRRSVSHLYADLPVSAAVQIVPLTCDDDGVPKPPDGWNRI